MSEEKTPQGRGRLWFNSYFGGILVSSVAILSSFVALPEAQLKHLPALIHSFLASGWAIAILGVLALFAALFPWLVQRPRYSELAELARKSTTKGLGLERVSKKLLAKLAAEVGLDTEETRVTVYYEYGGRFYSLARHSQNRVFAQKGRNDYPCDKGVIGHIWDSKDQIVRLPVDDKKWLEKTTGTWGFSPSGARSLSMKSRCIAGVFLQPDQDWIGLVVFEAMKPQAINQSHLEKASASWTFDLLADLVGSAGSSFNHFDSTKKLGKPAHKNVFDDEGWESLSRPQRAIAKAALQ